MDSNISDPFQPAVGRSDQGEQISIFLSELRELCRLLISLHSVNITSLITSRDFMYYVHVSTRAVPSSSST